MRRVLCIALVATVCAGCATTSSNGGNVAWKLLVGACRAIERIDEVQ